MSLWLELNQNLDRPFAHFPKLLVASKQALRGALAAGREQEQELATTSLEIEYLHRKSLCEMLIGGDDISNDIIIPLAHVFQCLFTFTLFSTSR